MTTEELKQRLQSSLKALLAENARLKAELAERNAPPTQEPEKVKRWGLGQLFRCSYSDAIFVLVPIGDHKGMLVAIDGSSHWEGPVDVDEKWTVAHETYSNPDLTPLPYTFTSLCKQGPIFLGLTEEEAERVTEWIDGGLNSVERAIKLKVVAALTAYRKAVRG